MGTRASLAADARAGPILADRNGMRQGPPTRWAILAALAAACSAGEGEASHGRPNVVFILADDLGIGDAGVYQPESRIPTPQLDRLAAEGIRFLDAHSPSAVCSPTRYAILTGEYAWRTRLQRGVLEGWDRSLIAGRTTIAEMFRAHGYATACIGKWHLGLGAYDPELPGRRADFDAPLDAGPHTLGFDHSFILPASADMPPYLWVEDGAVVEPATGLAGGEASQRHGGAGYHRPGPMAPDFRFEEILPTITARAESLIGDAARDGRPFFLYLPLTAPHTPWSPTAEFLGRSGAGPYGDFVAQVDDCVGRVRGALERAGVLDDTLLIVASDNGAHWLDSDVARWSHRANGPWRGQKADIHEGGHRVPLIARWPGRIPAGASSDALVGLQDLFATTGELLGASPEELAGARDSVSFLAALRGGAGAREELVLHSFDGMFAIRRGPWKWIEGLGSGGFTEPRRVASADPRAGQLYDLATDPGEQRNLSDDRPDEVAALRQRLGEIRAATPR